MSVAGLMYAIAGIFCSTDAFTSTENRPDRPQLNSETAVSIEDFMFSFTFKIAPISVPNEIAKKTPTNDSSTLFIEFLYAL